MDCMIDIETLSTSPNAVIMTIGAVKFNRKGKLQPLEDMQRFYRRITQHSCETIGLEVDPKTVEWWGQQSTEAKFEIYCDKDRIAIKKALLELKTFLTGVKYVWSHGASFDFVILGEAYKKCNIQVPWHFANIRDTRTLYDLSGVNMANIQQNNAHNALHDCHKQIIGVKMALQKLGLN